MVVMKLKRGIIDRKVEQEPTQPTSIHWIMSQPTFTLGAADARAGRRYHADYDLWNINGQWNYERGRQWASLAPRNVPLKRNGRVTREALKYFKAEII
jgi:hypothetical protein